MAAQKTEKTSWPAETLSGSIMMVNPADNLVVVKGPDGVPFDMIVTPRTRITSGQESVGLKNLAKFQNQNASVKFIPERRGDVAESIHIGG